MANLVTEIPERGVQPQNGRISLLFSYLFLLIPSFSPISIATELPPNVFMIALTIDLFLSHESSIMFFSFFPLLISFSSIEAHNSNVSLVYHSVLHAGRP